jgi:hypothetical protein
MYVYICSVRLYRSDDDDGDVMNIVMPLNKPSTVRKWVRVFEHWTQWVDFTKLRETFGKHFRLNPILDYLHF